jgi:GR25 family glycosyltransferase involved in LPS biosynthesis
MENKFIKLINLKRRLDRKNNMMEKLQNVSINTNEYEIIEAVDGKELKPTMYIKKLFEGNNFNYKRGVIGCALSHINLWERLINDDKNDYYVILEDDITFVDNFKEKLERSIELFLENKIEYALIGAHQITNENLNKDNIQIVNNNDYFWSCTYGYIISKTGSKKLLESIKNTSIKCPIDYSCIYTSCFDVYFLNEYIVHSYDYFYTNDTDIQNVYDFLDFSNMDENEENEKNKEVITISFTDWWIPEYCGGNFDKENNYFTNLLKDYYTVKVISEYENPDILFYSVFGSNHTNLKAKRKVFFSGESSAKREDADYNITFDENSENNCRLPLWLFYNINEQLIDNSSKKRNGIFEIPKKNKFCSIICSMDNSEGKRGEIVNKLSEYKKVDCGGQFLNNIGYIVPRGTNCSGKIEHNNDYKFVIAFESNMYPGYVTEKILDVYKSNCIPIYWGSSEVVNDFNPSTFINANNFNTIDELVEYIIKVDNDDELYASFFKEEIYSNYWLDIFNDSNKTFYKKLIKNIIIGN